MRRATVCLIAVGVYACCWVYAYHIVNQDFDQELMVEYFWLAWTGQGLERPAFVQIISLLLFTPFVGVALLVRSWRKRRAAR